MTNKLIDEAKQIERYGCTVKDLVRHRACTLADRYGTEVSEGAGTMNQNAETRMFGCSIESLTELVEGKDKHDLLAAAMSVLSDTQEGIERLDVKGATDRLRVEKARQRINVAKWLIDQVKTDLRRAGR